ncbi:hypothetical protein ACFL2B_00820 [Patescibacteria group bacterium]
MGPGEKAKPPNVPEQIDSFREFARDLEVPDGEMKTANEIAKAQEQGFTIGAKVKLSHLPEVGEIVGYNEEAGGLFPGSRCPVIIKFERGEFEYSLDQAELVEEENK